MKPPGTIEMADALVSRVGLLAALVLAFAAIGLFVGVTAMGVVCQLIEICGVVLALLGGVLHNVVLWRRFGFFHVWFSFKELYGGCPVRVRLFCLGLSVLGVVSFAALITARDTIAEPNRAAYTAFMFASVFVVWFSLMLAQTTSLLYGANPSFQGTLRDKAAHRP